jgi:hypothetical protein
LLQVCRLSVAMLVIAGAGFYWLAPHVWSGMHADMRLLLLEIAALREQLEAGDCSGPARSPCRS